MTTEPQADDRRARGLRLVTVLLGLTVVSGMIDAVSFLGLNHVFTANMTGNVLVLAFAAAGAVYFSVPHTVTSLACFLAGAVIGGRVAVRYGGARRTWVRVTLAVEAVLVGGAAAVALAAPDAGGTLYAVIALTALAMGLRNTTVVKLGVPDLTTTVLTRTLASLAADSRAGGGTGRRTPRRAAAVLAMPAGAVLGAWLVIHHGLGPPLLIAAGVTGLLALVASERE
ncbi:YoaK family protein [Streptomyces thermoalcalitolerans]|uniref:YoaK family protein n=1 Tax=Streptomyces thermoalcalitolerans TaxID=65605 RepID=A0ABP3YWH5_9ACTN